MKFLSLFSGIGGFDLGFERAGMECVGQCELDPYAQKVLKKHWPDVKLMPDVTKIKGDEFGQVDLICAGFPCQDLSTAGKQRGIHGERSGLFDEVIRIISILPEKPRWVVLENVPNLISGGNGEWFNYCLSRLAEVGMYCQWRLISAKAFGFPHKRERVFIIAHPKLGGSQIWSEYTTRQYSKTITEGGANGKEGKTTPKYFRSYNGFPKELDGNMIIPNRNHRNRVLGNIVIPQISEYIGNQIQEVENDSQEYNGKL